MNRLLIAFLFAWPSLASAGKLSLALDAKFQSSGRAAPPPLQNAAALPVIVLDAGHGGEDWGAVVKGEREKDITLAMARKVKARLESMGLAKVVLTREDDTYIQLDERVGQSVSAGGTIFVSLHANKVRQRSLTGITVYAFGRDHRRSKRRRSRRHLLPLPPPSAESARRSAELASGMVRFLRGDGFRVETAARADYYVLKNPSLPSVLVEMGYLSNPKEAALLGDPAYQDRLSDSLARSLTACLSGAPGLSTAGR